MDKQLLKEIALIEGLTTYHYKVLLLLIEKERTQSQLCKELGINKQNVNKVCKTLEQYGIISVSKIDGQLKYLKVNSSLKELPMPGQVKF